MQDIDSVPSNVQSASQEALLYVYENNEAVIKMITIVAKIITDLTRYRPIVLELI